MECKYYVVRFNKNNVDKNNEKELYAFKTLRNRLRVFNSKNLYVQLFSGNIACQDAFYNNSAKHMPILIRVDEDGDAYEYVYDVKIDLVGPIEKGEEITLKEAYSRLKQLENDPLSLYSYRESVKDCVSIINEYKENLITNPNTSNRTRK